MKVTPIFAPLPGEHLATVHPRMEPAAEVEWRRRLNFWTGRALTKSALEIEQTHRAARLAWRGRLVTPGIVHGLELALETLPQEAVPGPAAQRPTLKGRLVHLQPGLGVVSTGEDVVVPRPLRVELADVPVVYARFSTAPLGQTPASATNGGKKPPRVTTLGFGGFSMRLRLLAEGYVPWAAVLVLCPAEVSRLAGRDAFDPCALDPSRDAFEDPRRVDAAQLLLCVLQPQWKRDSLVMGSAGDVTWRNRVASLLLREEAARTRRQQFEVRQMATGRRFDARLEAGELLPWEALGLPLALIGFEPAPNPPAGKSPRRLFLDRAAAARPGGSARPRPRPVAALATDAARPPGVGTPSLWRARVEQFNEHLRDLLSEDAFRLDDTMPKAEAQQAIQNLATRFKHLPPAGLLPRAALNFLTTAEADKLGRPDRADTSWFFPQAFDVRAAPVPTEQLEAVLAASAPLDCFDFTRPEKVCVLAPLPQRVFDPQLLVIEKEDEFFKTEVARLYALRQDWCQRREYVRGRHEALSLLVGGGPKRAPGPRRPDADQLEPEPVETLESIGLPCEVIPPANTPEPWKLEVRFGKTHRLGQLARLRVHLHIDEETPPSRIEFQWLADESRVSDAFDTLPPVRVDEAILKPGAMPASVSLRRVFEREVQGSVLSALNPNSSLRAVTIVLHGGRAAIARVTATEQRTNRELTLWQPVRPPTGGRPDGWQPVASALLFAPFEDLHKPTPADGSHFQDRLNALSPVLAELAPELKKLEPRLGGLTHLTLNAVGLERLIAVVEQEANKAEEAVGIGMAKVQAHLQRLQGVVLGEDDAEEALSSPAISSMVVAKQGVVAQSRVREALVGNPNWTQKKDVQPTALKEQTESLDDSRSSSPRLLKFTKRFAYGAAFQAYEAVRAALIEVLKDLAPLKVGFDSERLPGITKDAEGRVSVAFSELPILQPAAFADLRFGYTDLLQGDKVIAQSGDIVAKGIHRADLIALILRKVESYIARRRELIAGARLALAAARAQMSAAALRVEGLNAKLSETRHDLSVGRALWQEELDRVAQVNARRDAILAREVRFLAFVRPRTVDLARRDAPSFELENVETPAPVPACLARNDEPPEQLRAYVQLFRYSPARWFPAVAPRLRELNTRERLAQLVETARQSASRVLAEKAEVRSEGNGAQALRAVYQTGLARIQQQRRRTAALQPARPESKSWDEQHREAEEHASLGDVIEGRHGNAALARAAAEELDRIEQVATCLHAEFGTVAPATRLLWVERYSQFDRPAPLRYLSMLPRYGALPRATRRRFQDFVDWLFNHVQSDEADAFNLVNDLVRLCLLLASHAPVNRLILGHVPRPTPVRPGLVIPIRPVQPALVRIGMEFQVWQANAVVARGRVEDALDGEVSARVEETRAQSMTVDASMQIQFLPAVQKAVRMG